MREDSPTFIRFFTPQPAGDAYGLALALAAATTRVVEHATVRIQVRDRLDRLVTAIVMELSRAQWELPSQRWRQARTSLRWATDCAALLDLIAAQGGTPAGDVESARAGARALCDALAPLGCVGIRRGD